MLIPITRCLAITAIVLCNPEQSAAAFDPQYNCRTLRDETGVRVDGNPVDLQQGTTVWLTFSHVGYGYFPVHLRLPGEIGIAAYDGKVLGDVKELPKDKVLRNIDGFVWVHAPDGDTENPIAIGLDCGEPY
ncbi:hypothetical protein AAFO92_11030 [Roseovarius sp. CAU 1744]|uniref:hypothetical protein n=1 Tax=Roseovarius sp. CAU 1744 TaxID=3140368 RepID=UPI00325B3ECC